LFLSIFTLNEKLAAGVQSIDRDTMQFLKSWLVDHILKDDMDLGEFISRKARAALRASESKPANAAAGPASPDPAVPSKNSETAAEQPADGDEEQ